MKRPKSNPRSKAGAKDSLSFEDSSTQAKAASPSHRCSQEVKKESAVAEAEAEAEADAEADEGTSLSSDVIVETVGVEVVATLVASDSGGGDTLDGPRVSRSRLMVLLTVNRF